MGFISELFRPKARIEITGSLPESFINAASSAGVELKAVRYLDRCRISAEVCERDLAALERLSRMTMCDIKTAESSESRRLLRRRISFPAALLAGLLLLAVSGLFVWDIDIEGNEKLTNGEILRSLDKAGLVYGSFRPLLDSEIIRTRALADMPELSWLGVSLSGSTAKVRVLEREEEPELFNDETHTDIRASKNGVIVRMSVLSGEPIVKVGDAVIKDSVLVSGTVGSITAEPRCVRSSGEVYAFTWYELTAEAPAETGVKTAFCRPRDRFAVQIGKNRINFYSNSRNNIDECGKIIYEYKIGIKGVFSLPIKLVRERITKYELENREYSNIENMKSRLYEALNNECQGEIQTYAWSCSKHDGVISVTLRAQCLENIASERKSQ